MLTIKQLMLKIKGGKELIRKESGLQEGPVLYVHYVRWAPEDMIWMRMIGRPLRSESMNEY